MYFFELLSERVNWVLVSTFPSLSDPDLGRASPLDVALDGLHKFRQLADEFFGPDFNGAHSTTGTTAKPSTLSKLGGAGRDGYSYSPRTVCETRYRTQNYQPNPL